LYEIFFYILMIDNQKIIDATIVFVKETLKDAESGHDWFHIERVWKNALLIYQGESLTNPNLNLTAIQLGALLHDIADHKFHNGDDTIGSKVAREFLQSLGCEESLISTVCEIILKISYKGSNAKNEMELLEGKIVQDADRLDAIGAIGVARAFSYGGYRNRQMYVPEEKPDMNMDWEAYKKNTGHTINHFYEKLLLLKDKMNTETGKKIAQKRHDYMVGFLEEFYSEWNGKS
jgi:uncharacterized protein